MGLRNTACKTSRIFEGDRIIYRIQGADLEATILLKTQKIKS